MHAQKQIKQTKSSDTGNGTMQLFFLSFCLSQGESYGNKTYHLYNSLSLSLSLIFCSCMSKERQEQKKSLQERPRMQMDLYPTLLLDSVETNRSKNQMKRILRNFMGILMNCIKFCNPYTWIYIYINWSNENVKVGPCCLTKKKVQLGSRCLIMLFFKSSSHLATPQHMSSSTSALYSKF